MNFVKQYQPRKPDEKNTQQLYQEALLTHHKNPVGFEKTIPISASHSGVNPACGDEITVEVSIDRHETNLFIKDIAFHGDSCAICRASASIMCQEVSQETVADAKVLAQQLTGVLVTNIALIGELAEQFSPLLTVQQFPIRKQCALLPWNTLLQVIAQADNNSHTR
ncbi:Fe-S cluster assembly sulfur transfer protein SufU [Thalassotalea sediminis]|uniref:Fe-S cluster assembly sulfur transfer protein SufU n=1 Tax=Thalassotalea sediminis TaxID=1759089 RepID=UPI0025727F6A|nr:SUF system NifU family Fe-S cluster assembly protein [Thalassotalea sediminis]